MASIPHSEPGETIAVRVATIKLLTDVRRAQLACRVRYDGPKVPRLILKESDLDKELSVLPHEGMAHELIDLTPAQVEQVLHMRTLQQEARRNKRFSSDRELSQAQRAVDEMLAGLASPRIAQEGRELVAAGARADEDETDNAHWMPYKED